MTLEEKIELFGGIVRANSPLLVAYSGGVDSTCLVALAVREPGVKVLAVIADSASLPREALRGAVRVAEGIGVSVEVVATEEFENESYLSNPPNRCYFCKAELFQKLERLGAERGFRAIAYGENADDPAELRPGSRAAAEFSVVAPLKQAGLTKAEVREISRRLGLPTHDAPAQPCLSSRIPHGTRVTREALALVEAGEAAVRGFGFQVFRVRYVEGAPAGARLQVAHEEMPRLVGREESVVQALKCAGFGWVEIDPAGYGSR